MSVGELSVPPSDLDFTNTPCGSIRVDPLCANYSIYKKIARGSGPDTNVGFPIQTALWFTLMDYEYGLQDNTQHNYDEVAPYMRAEAFKYYAGSQNEHLEFMVRFFAFSDPRVDVHAQYEYLRAIQYPWIDYADGGRKYSPPRLMMVLNTSVVRLGYIAATNATWFSPLGFDGVIDNPLSNGVDDLATVPVSFFCEVLLTFVVAGDSYDTSGFRDVASGNQSMRNFKQLNTKRLP